MSASALLELSEQATDLHDTLPPQVRAIVESAVISPTHKRTEGRAPVWGSEFTIKVAHYRGGIQQKPLPG